MAIALKLTNCFFTYLIVIYFYSTPLNVDSQRVNRFPRSELRNRRKAIAQQRAQIGQPWQVLNDQSVVPNSGQTASATRPSTKLSSPRLPLSTLCQSGLCKCYPNRGAVECHVAGLKAIPNAIPLDTQRLYTSPHFTIISSI